MLTIGCHLSVSKGFANMAKEAVSINANTFQFFSRNPRGGKAKEINQKDLNEFFEIASINHFGKILAHAPYTVNPCSADEKIRDFARTTMKDDLMRMELVPNNLYNFHPGSHVGQGSEKGIELTASILNDIITKKQTTTILLETMSGKGSEIGRNFNELRAIIDKVEINEKLGVCFDTCHVYDGGYDIVNNLNKVLEEFDKIIGLNRLKAIHINDSKNPINSHKDRHEKIGEGYIGLAAFEKIINHSALKGLPFFLETPNEMNGYRKEIEVLRGLYKE